MKKLTFISVIALAICGCNHNKDIGDEVEFNIVEVKYDGHSYLVFDGYGVVHNQNCICYDND